MAGNGIDYITRFEIVERNQHDWKVQADASRLIRKNIIRLAQRMEKYSPFAVMSTGECSG